MKKQAFVYTYDGSLVPLIVVSLVAVHLGLLIRIQRFKANCSLGISLFLIADSRDAIVEWSGGGRLCGRFRHMHLVLDINLPTCVLFNP